jgi:urea carboxylase
MSFSANFTALAVCRELESRGHAGIVEIAQANASLLVRLNPDEIDPKKLMAELREIYDGTDTAQLSFSTRVFDVPALYNDPWTHEVLMKFRDRHQTPDKTDLEYVTEINGFATQEEFIQAHHGAPYYASMLGFVPGLPWCYQMVHREKMLEVPKYVRPRTDTPARALSHGGAFAAIYPVQGPGGYQLFAICAAPIFDPTQSLPDFQDSFAIFRGGDILKFRPVDRAEYDAIREEVEAGVFRYRKIDVDFEPAEFFADPEAYNASLLARLYA